MASSTSASGSLVRTSSGSARTTITLGGAGLVQTCAAPRGGFLNLTTREFRGNATRARSERACVLACVRDAVTTIGRASIGASRYVVRCALCVVRRDKCLLVFSAINISLARRPASFAWIRRWRSACALETTDAALKSPDVALSSSCPPRSLATAAYDRDALYHRYREE